MQLVDVHEAVFEDRLDHGTGAFGNGVERDELRLHVGRKRRVRSSTHVHRFRAFAVHVQLDPVFTGGDLGACFLELLKDGFKDGRISVLDLHAATGDGSGYQVSTGFNTVRHDAVGRRMQLFDAIDGDGIGAGTADLGAHGVQEVGQVNDFRLACRVLQDAAAIGQRCSHHDVFGTGHTDGIEEEVGTVQAAFWRLGLDIAAFDVDHGAHGVQEVGQVDDFRLACRVLQYAAAVGQCCGHHDVLGTGHADGIKEEVGTVQAAFRGLSFDVAAFDVDHGAHGFKATNVQVNRTRANGAAARQGNFSVTETCNHRPQYQDRCAHGFHQLIRRDQGFDGVRVDFDTELFIDHRLNAHATEQLDHGGDVMQMRQVGYSDRAIAQQGRCQDRQGGVLRPGNADFAIKTGTAGNNQFIHNNLDANGLRGLRCARPRPRC